MSVRGGSVEYHALLCKNCHSYPTFKEHKLDRGFISIFCYTDSHYVQKANEQIEQGERCAYKDIPLRQYSCHIIGHMTFSSHCEIRRGVAKLCHSL